jgi:antagonist of KipI
MSIRIIKHGVFDTIQDLGRYGFQHIGINPGGVQDDTALRTANILVENNINVAAIELHFPASSLWFEEDTIIAISGAAFSPMLNESELPLNTPILVKKYTLLEFTKHKTGTACYLAIHGGFDLPEWLGSRSTNIKAMTGGLNGKVLRKDDKLPLAKKLDFTHLLHDRNFIVLPWQADTFPLYTPDAFIRICAGNAFGELTPASKTHLLSLRFTITLQSDRMGYRLNGEPLRRKTPTEKVSSAVSKGTIQLLPDGQLIVLMADHQTMGGYPLMAYVIAADLPKLAQMQPGQQFQFQLVDHSEAEDLEFQRHQYLQKLENGCRLKWLDYWNTAANNENANSSNL